MSTSWYGRDGRVLVSENLVSGSYVWEEKMREVEKLLGDPNYKVVRVDETPNGKYKVSTVWLGLDHRFSGDGPPLIFETAVFEEVTDGDNEMIRWSTELEALVGHAKLLDKYCWLEAGVEAIQ